MKKFTRRQKATLRRINKNLPSTRSCRVCGCTNLDSSQCIEKTGQPCHWVEEDLCSACAEVEQPSPIELAMRALKHLVPRVKRRLSTINPNDHYGLLQS